MGPRASDPPQLNDKDAAPAAGEFNGMLGQAPCMRALFDQIRRIAPLNVGVLVHGENGTGKERVARALHRLSHRSGKFIAVDCGAITPDLPSSQLPGVEASAFSAAAQSLAGLIEQAQGGTLFLDEIIEMPLAQQAHLSRVTENHVVTRLGDARETPTDVRVIAASNCDMRHAVATGAMRSDLFLRLLELPLVVPPLRERPEDIGLLARHFVERLNACHGTCKHLSGPALHELELRYWPGNVRELRHVVKREYIMSGHAKEIDFGPELEQPWYRRASEHPGCGGDRRVSPQAAGDQDGIRFRLGTTLEDIERTVLLETLAQCHHDKREAARLLGISLKTVYNRLRHYRSRGLMVEDIPGEPK